MRVLLDEHLPHRLRQLFAAPIEKEHFMKHRDNLLWTFPRAATVVLLLLFCTINTTPAQTTLSAEDIAEKALAATVYLEMQDKNGNKLGFGSGFFVQPNLIATNYHVIEGAAKGTAKLVGKYTTYNIEGVTATDKVNDLVLLKVTAYGIKPLSLGNSDTVRIGETVYVAGNPKGLEGTFSDGIISSRRNRDTKERLQMTAPISPGSSGGPVLNRKGEVIGMSFARHRAIDAENLNFAIPSKYLKTLLEQSKPTQPLSQRNLFISAETYLKWGIIKSLSGNYNGAIADYNMAIRIKPNYESYCARGLAKINLGKHLVAIIDFDKAIKIKPEAFAAYYYRGLAKAKLKRHIDAIADYNKAIRLDSSYAIAYFYRGNVKTSLGQYYAAITDYTNAIRLNPDFTEAYLNRGHVKAILSQYFAAISDYDKAIRHKPDYADPYLFRGNIKSLLGQHSAAIADYDKAIKIDPNYDEVYLRRGNAKVEFGKHFAAISDYDTAIRLKPDYAEAYLNRGDAKAKLKQYIAAIADYNKAIQLNPNSAMAYVSRGGAKYDLRRISEAKRDYFIALGIARRTGEKNIQTAVEKILQNIARIEELRKHY